MLDELAPERPVARAEPALKSTYIEPSAENFRACCGETLAMLRACQANPWNPLDARFNRVVFRLRSEWLPDEEGSALREEFAAHWHRLGIVESELAPYQAS